MLSLRACSWSVQVTIPPRFDSMNSVVWWRSWKIRRRPMTLLLLMRTCHRRQQPIFCFSNRQCSTASFLFPYLCLSLYFFFCCFNCKSLLIGSSFHLSKAKQGDFLCIVLVLFVTKKENFSNKKSKWVVEEIELVFCCTLRHFGLPKVLDTRCMKRWVETW